MCGSIFSTSRQCAQVAQVVGFAAAGGHQHAAVPQRVQVGALAVEIDLHVVAALVVGVAGMQRLVHVTDEMHHELQGLRALGAAALAVGEDGDLRLQRAHHAIAVGAVACGLVGALLFAEIDEMPATAAPAQVRIVLAQVIRPGRDARQAGIGFTL